MTSYNERVEKIMKAFFDIQDHLGNYIKVRSKKDGRVFEGYISREMGDLYLKWPGVHFIITDAIVYHNGKEERHSKVYLQLKPLTREFEYCFQ